MAYFKGKKYELLFNNDLSPLIALNFADELFFEQFKKLCGVKYRILSIMAEGRQKKYVLSADLKKLKKRFDKKIADNNWSLIILKKYKKKSEKLNKLLLQIDKREFRIVSNRELILCLKKIRIMAAQLDAMSNMFNLFSSLIGDKFYTNLKKYDYKKLEDNFIYYTQPIEDSRWAKVKIKKIEDKIKLSKYDQNFSDILRVGNFIKDDVSKLIYLRGKFLEGLFLEISSRLNCNYEDLYFLQINEIENFLLGKGTAQRLITDRKEMTLLYYKKNKLEVCEGKNAKNFLKYGKFIDNENIKKTNILFGQAASLGKARGKAVIALSSEEANKKMKKGNILVSSFTSVEFVKAMRKALAIITDEGGLTCHAAIVSREFNIPCLVGLKYATKVFKDGDLLEVNVRDGFVKRI